MKTFKEWMEEKRKGECISCKSFSSLNDNKLCMDCQRIVNSNL
jgi:hypothetical protein